MKRKQRDAAELEAELLRLNTLVRERREQLARLETCPNKSCPCRAVWRQVVEENLASQVGKIRRQVRGKPRQTRKASPTAKAKARRPA
jgi:hypothetical protein